MSEWGVSPERDIWSLCVVACWWLWGVAVVGSPSPSASFYAGTTWGPKNQQKFKKIEKIHKRHAPKIQGRVFSEVAEAPQADTTHRTARGGTLKPVKMTIISRKCKKMLTVPKFNIWKLKSCNMSGNSFRISKNPDMVKTEKSENTGFGPSLLSA